MPFLQALRSLLDQGKLKAEALRVRFIGNVEFAEGQRVMDMVQQMCLEGIVSVEPPIGRDDAIRLTCQSHVILVLDEHHPTLIPFKLYDALPTCAVILNIGSKGAVAEVLERTGRGIGVSHRDPGEIEKGILECIRRSREDNGRFEPWTEGQVLKYDFEGLTHTLVGALESQ